MVAAVVRGEVHQSVGLLSDLSDGLHDPADPLVHLPDGVPVGAVEAATPPPDGEMYQKEQIPDWSLKKTRSASL